MPLLAGYQIIGAVTLVSAGLQRRQLVCKHFLHRAGQLCLPLGLQVSNFFGWALGRQRIVLRLWPSTKGIEQLVNPKDGGTHRILAEVLRRGASLAGWLCTSGSINLGQNRQLIEHSPFFLY